MAEATRNQATGGDGAKGAPDGTNLTPGTGESQGGARPGKEGHGDGGEDAGFIGHGGQSNIGYHGPEQLGDDQVFEDNKNAATRDG